MQNFLICTAIACFEAFVIINIISGNKPLRLEPLLKSHHEDVLATVYSFW